jgi:sirohydrochlorin ferrochelatase
LALPTIAIGGDRCVTRGATRVLMVPYFLSAGVHLERDLTAARDDLASRYPNVTFQLGLPLGPHLLLDKLVEERIREMDPNDR